MLKRAYLSIAVLMSALTGFASDDEIIDLEPMVVIGYPVTEESQIRPNGKVDVISQSILESLNAGDLTSALRRVPGVTVSRYNPVGAFGGSDGGGIFIRGHGSGRPGADITTMIDGIPLFVGVWTHPLIDTLSVDMAGSIEVMKSPQPVLVGSMGFGAVNLVPKVADFEGHRRDIEGSYGHHETSLIRAGYTYLNEQVGMVISGSHRQSDGHRENADGEVDALYGNFSYTWNDRWSVSLLVSVTDSWANDPEPEGLLLPITERYETRDRFYLGKVIYEGVYTDFEIKLHAENGQGDWLQWHQAPPPPFPSQTLDTLTTYDNYGMKSKWSGGMGESGSWILGLNWDQFGGSVLETYDSGPVNRFDNKQFELISPYLMVTGNYEWQGRELEINGGLRYMNHSVFDAKWVGQMGIVLKNPRVHTYFNFADSVNYPGVYVSVFGRREPPWNVGEAWRELEAESIRHYEIGAKVLVSNQLSFDLSLFRDEVENALTFVTPPPVGYILNLGVYSIQGAEFLLHYHRGIWSAFSGITWLDSKQDIPNAPEWSAMVGANLKKGRWSFATDFQKVSEQSTLNPRFDEIHQQVDGYQLLNARIVYRVESGATGYWECYLYGENLTNESYEYRPGYPMPGISLTMGIKREW